MCLALPAKVVTVTGQRALVEVEGRLRVVSLVALPSVVVGDYVLANLGLAVRQITAEQAAEILKALDTMGKMTGEQA